MDIDLFHFLGLYIKVTDEFFALMLWNNVYDSLGKFMRPCQFDTIFYVRGNNQGAHGGRKSLMAIVTFLIFDKVFGLFHLSNVVKVTGNTRKQAVGPNRIATRLG